MATEEDYNEGKLFAAFDKFDEFRNTESTLLSCPLNEEPGPDEDRQELMLLKALIDILDEYQEQSYLLDPFLERLVTPVAELLRLHVKQFTDNPSGYTSASRVDRITNLLYGFIKLRGYKTIIRFFPHEVADLSIALDYIYTPRVLTQEPKHWSLRYVLLLWLSLICMIPFDLAAFDEGESRTSTRLEALGCSFLGKAGLEREGAALQLSKLYVRKDMRSAFSEFLKRAVHRVKESADIFMSLGQLQVICEVVKSGAAEQVEENASLIIDVIHAVEGNTALMNNTIARKLKTKLLSRTALRLLPAASRYRYSKGRALLSDSSEGVSQLSGQIDEEVEVPEEVEMILQELFAALQDKDTVVRWSAAKGLARTAERLPSDFADQVFDTVLGLFEIHSPAVAQLYDLPTIAESTWHGACLACAEMTRRSLVSEENLPRLIDWSIKALYFDIRKGAHSIGSNVRDAAAYVLWSLARAQTVAALAPHADDLSRRLVTVSLFDREIHIRRAASAAFQEYVGRTSLFAHGIDVLRKTDFFAVSVRRNAFLVAAPQVAEHKEYRSSLIEHLLNVTLRHWDPAMRQLGAQSLRIICEQDIPNLGSLAIDRALSLLSSVDNSDIHGGLLALTELATAYNGQSSEEKNKIFSCLTLVPIQKLYAPRNDLLAAAACFLIANSISPSQVQRGESPSVPQWREIINAGLKHRDGAVQEAAADAWRAISGLVDCSDVVRRLIEELASGAPSSQQSLGRVLGVLNYRAYSHALHDALDCLLNSVKASSASKFENVEARRNCYISMYQIILTISPEISAHLAPDRARALFDALLEGLKDYTVDQRGDIGSWIRIACIIGVTEVSRAFITSAAYVNNFEDYLPPLRYHEAVGGILKQGVERLDNVRQQAGECFTRLLLGSPPNVPNSERWRVEKEDTLKELFTNETERVGWNEGEWLFPRAVRLLDIERYRRPVLAGLVFSIGSKADSTHRPVSSSLVAYAQSLPTTSDGSAYDLCGFVADLMLDLKGNMSNNNIVIPVLQTFNALLDADALTRLSDDPRGLSSLRTFLSLVSRNVSRLKNVQRVQASMKVVVNLLPISVLYKDLVSLVAQFLTHAYPTIRSDTAEYLYLVLQSKDIGHETEEAEDILLETEWVANDMSVVQDAAQRFTDAMLS